MTDPTRLTAHRLPDGIPLSPAPPPPVPPNESDTLFGGKWLRSPFVGDDRPRNIFPGELVQPPKTTPKTCTHPDPPGPDVADGSLWRCICGQHFVARRHQGGGLTWDGIGRQRAERILRRWRRQRRS